MDYISATNIIIFFVLFLYNYSVFALVIGIFEEKNCKNWLTILFSICNATLFILFMMEQPNLLFLYLCLSILFCIEFYILIRSNFLDILLVVNAVMINIMATQSAILCVYGWITGLCLYSIIQTPEHFINSSTTSLITLIALTFLISKNFSLSRLRKVFKSKVQKNFLFVWFVTIYIYFIYNANIYFLIDIRGFSIMNQFFSSIAFLFSFFYMLVYAYKNCQIIELVEENIYYKTELVNQHKIVGNFTQNANSKFEASLTQNRIFPGNSLYENMLARNNYNYTHFCEDVIRSLVHPDYHESVLDMLAVDYLLSVFEQGTTVQALEFLQKNNKDDDDSYTWSRCTLSMLRDERTHEVKALIYIEDINEEKRLHDTLALKAISDALSGLNNKEHTQKRIVEYLKTGEGVLFLVDVDNFKEINDSMGHSVGDEVLCSLSSALKLIFRDEDVIGRIGGDEFMIYIPRALTMENIILKAQQIVDAFYSEYLDQKGEKHIISSSVGIYQVGNKNCTFEDAYRKADIAMYQTKRSSKNGYTIYSGGDFCGCEPDRKIF